MSSSAGPRQVQATESAAPSFAASFLLTSVQQAPTTGEVLMAAPVTSGEPTTSSMSHTTLGPRISEDDDFGSFATAGSSGGNGGGAKPAGGADSEDPFGDFSSFEGTSAVSSSSSFAAPVQPPPRATAAKIEDRFASLTGFNLDAEPVRPSPKILQRNAEPSAAESPSVIPASSRARPVDYSALAGVSTGDLILS